LKEINFKGACLVAAHQYLSATEGRGYLDLNGKPAIEKRNYFEQLGSALIAYQIQNKNG
jgi:hypothetical protein